MFARNLAIKPFYYNSRPADDKLYLTAHLYIEQH